MLTNQELEERFVADGIPEVGRERIRHIRMNVPVRVAGTNTMGNRTRLCSQKMGFVVDTEASHTEYPTALVWDYDEETIEFYPQPTKLKIVWKNQEGRTHSYFSTPDFFRISNNGFEFIECKLESGLLELGRKYPTRYILDEFDKWRSPPGEAAAALLGCKYVLRSSEENNWILIENHEFLYDYLVQAPNIDRSELNLLRQRLTDKPWCSINELIHTEPRVKADTLYSAISQNEVYFDQTKYRLTETQSSGVFRNREMAIAYDIFVASRSESKFSDAQLSLLPGQRFDWDGHAWEILNVGSKAIAARQVNSQIDSDFAIIEIPHDQVSALAKSGKIIPIHSAKDNAAIPKDFFKNFDELHLQEAVWRHEILFGTPSNGNQLKDVSMRTKQYWLSAWRKSELLNGYGFAGLIRNSNKTQGNTNRKLDSDVIKIMTDLIDEEWSKPTQKSLTNIFGKVALQCVATGLDAPSRKTFNLEVKKRKSQKLLISRVGRRMAYESEAIQHWWLEYTTPTHGTHPFHIAHIDSTPLDIKLKDKSLQHSVKTVWLTLMLDAFTRKVLAFYLSFDHPSYRSNMMVIRDCVRRHGRLPQLIVSDCGPEFQSVYYETLLATFSVHKRDRPKSKPRAGSIIERIFRTTREAFINNLSGNTQAQREWRKVSPEVDPVKFSIWEYERLSLRLEQFFDDVYHKNNHTTLGCSPHQKYIEGLAQFGERQHRRISYTREFIIQTLPSTSKGTSRVTNRGVKINYLYYSSPALASLLLRKTSVAVRFDPFDAGYAYVFVEGSWEECISEYHSIFKIYSSHSITLVSKYLRLKFRNSEKAYEVNAQRLAEFLQSTEADEVIGLQKLHDLQSVDTRQRLATPDSISTATPNVDESDDIYEPKFSDDEYVPKSLEDF